jgi:hypothetical protein
MARSQGDGCHRRRLRPDKSFARSTDFAGYLTS